MDLGPLGVVHLTWGLFSDFLSIIFINLVLSGDNAVVIAMAVRCLPTAQRKKGIILGAGAAIVLRIVLTFFVTMLLQVNYVKLLGGILIVWIAFKLLTESNPDGSCSKEAVNPWQAVKIIMIADVTMSTDNVLALGAAAHGNMFLLILGLSLSIPFVVFASNILSVLMDRYPVIIYAGAAILGKVGGEMIINDPVTISLIDPGDALQYGVQACFAVGVLAVGQLWLMKHRRVEEATAVSRAKNRRG